MAGERLRLALAECSTKEEVAEVWQLELRREQMLDNLGFGGDGDVPVLGLDEQEDELLMSQVKDYDFARERHRYRGIPLSSATVDEARRARESDIDDMTRREWDDE
jgi:hypothetical protein